MLESNTLTGTHMKRPLQLKSECRQPSGKLPIRNATLNNLKDVNVDIPTGVMTVVTGVAGSGKSTLINDIFLSQHPDAIVIDQSAVGVSTRSNPATYTGIMDDVRKAELELTVEGMDGFVLKGQSSMKEISRDPLDLVRQTIGGHHQYPDGFMLYLGTLFAPVEDRDVAGEGFTHKVGDIVSISSPALGTLLNIVRLSTECPPWTFGAGALMRNLAGRGLI